MPFLTFPNCILVTVQVGNKYGINMHKDELDGLKRIYGQFLEACIPLGDNQLKGDEADKVSSSGTCPHKFPHHIPSTCMRHTACRGSACRGRRCSCFAC